MSLDRLTEIVKQRFIGHAYDDCRIEMSADTFQTLQAGWSEAFEDANLRSFRMSPLFGIPIELSPAIPNGVWRLTRTRAFPVPDGSWDLVEEGQL